MESMMKARKPRGRRFLMSEAPLYPIPPTTFPLPRSRRYRGTSLIRKSLPMEQVVGAMIEEGNMPSHDTYQSTKLIVHC